MLTDRQKRFVFEYGKDCIAIKAYIRAGYSERGAASGASALMDNPEVLEAIEEQKEMLACVARLSPEWVLHQWMQIASANPADIVKVVCEPCGECWAISDPLLPPNPACKACEGRGCSHVVITDTRQLSGAARRLYAGAVQTRDGIKIQMRDQNEALKNLADYLGMLNKSKGELSGPGGGPIPVLHATPAELSDEQLLAIAGAGSANLGVTTGVSSDSHVGMTIEATL